VAFLPVLIIAQTPFRECGNGLPTPNSVDITGCLVEPCLFIRGTVSFHRIDFTSGEIFCFTYFQSGIKFSETFAISAISTNTIRPSVRAILLGIGIEYRNFNLLEYYFNMNKTSFSPEYIFSAS
jgi:hypothetical protein